MKKIAYAIAMAATALTVLQATTPAAQASTNFKVRFAKASFMQVDNFHKFGRYIHRSIFEHKREIQLELTRQNLCDDSKTSLANLQVRLSEAYRMQKFFMLTGLNERETPEHRDIGYRYFSRATKELIPLIRGKIENWQTRKAQVCILK